MKVLASDLNVDVSLTYDNTKTTIHGMVYQKIINSAPVLGPPLNKWIDIVTDTLGSIPSGVFYVSDTMTGDVIRIFMLAGLLAGVAEVLLYNFNIATGDNSFVGRIRFAVPNLAATTHTARGIVVEDTGTTGWKLVLTTVGSVLINGGTFLVNNLALSDFVLVAPLIPFATGNDQKAVYFLQDPANMGAGQLNTATAGTLIHNHKVYVHDGLAATHRFFVHDITAAPTWSSAAVTMTQADDVVADTGHTFILGDQVTFTVLTGGAGLVAGTTYFVRDVVAGVSYKLAATSGGAAINITTDGTGTIGRAFGITGSNWSNKTGLLPALSGTLLLTNSEKVATPNHGSNIGQRCAAFGTTTNLYLGQLVDLTSGATSWPTLATSNIQPSALVTTPLTATYLAWSDLLDRFMFVAASMRVHIKQLINNSIDLYYSNLSNQYLETVIPEVVDLGFTTVVGIRGRYGWMFMCGGTAGQRGLIACNVYSNSLFDDSYVITKVLNLHSTPQTLATIEQLFEWTTNSRFFYRNSGFGSATGGWIEIAIASDLSSIVMGPEVQFKILFSLNDEFGGNPSQLSELGLAYISDSEISDNWEYSTDDSSTTSPSRAAFRLRNAYSSVVPTIHFRAYDLTDALVVHHDSVAEAANFEYSTDNGVTWLPLGTIPNTVGTLIRYTFTSPPGVPVRVSVRES